ncbi:MAG: cell envelope integrity EipB family protein [Oricola sp.]
MNHKIGKTITGAAVWVVVVVGLVSPAQAAAPILASHRAVYDIALKHASDASGITDVSGRIVYEFKGSACEGYSTNYRFVMKIRSVGGNEVTDQQVISFEDGTGENFRFLSKSFVDDRLEQELSGMAAHDGEATTITLKKPKEAEFTLASALFPTAHTIDLLQRAATGESIYETKIFDGSDGGDRVMTTTVIVGPQKSGTEGDGENAGPLKSEPFRNVSISYFDEEDENGGESLPAYQTSFKLYDNGVTRDLLMDYGDYALTGSLNQIEILPQESCK